MALVHSFVYPAVGIALGPVSIAASAFQLYKVNDSETNAPADGQSTNFAYFAHATSLLLGGFNTFKELTKKKKGDHGPPPPRPEEGGNSTDSNNQPPPPQDGEAPAL